MSNRTETYRVKVEPFLSAIFYWKSEGITDDEIANRLGVSVRSLRRYANLYPEYKTVHNFSIDNQRGALVEKAFEQAMQGNAAMIMFLLKTRCGYKETNVIEANQTITNSYERLSNEQLLEIAKLSKIKRGK